MKLIGASSTPRLQRLLDTILDGWSVDAEGRLTTSDINVKFYQAAFRQSLGYDSERLSEVEFGKCVRDAIRDMKLEGSASLDRFTALFHSAEARVRSAPRSRYFLATRCAFGSDNDLWLPLRLWGSRAVLTNRVVPAIDSSPFFLDGYGDVKPGEPHFGLTYIGGPYVVRDEDAALTQGARVAASFFGLLSFATRLSSLKWVIGGVRTLSNIRPGPEYILYDKDWARNESHISFFYVPPTKFHWLSDKECEGLVYALKWAAYIGRLDRARQIYARDFMRLYFDAVSEVELEMQVVRLWKAAEYATFSQGSSTEQIAKRLSLTFGEYPVVEAVCHAVGRWRHLTVHSEQQALRESDTPEFFRYLLEKFVRSALSSKVPNLETWRATLEIGSTRFSNEALQRALPLLTSMPARS